MIVLLREGEVLVFLKIVGNSFLIVVWKKSTVRLSRHVRTRDDLLLSVLQYGYLEWSWYFCIFSMCPTPMQPEANFA